MSIKWNITKSAREKDEESEQQESGFAGSFKRKDPCQDGDCKDKKRKSAKEKEAEAAERE